MANKLSADKYKLDLNAEYLFENFIVNDSNKFAYMSALAFADISTIRQSKLVYLYGEKGLGKTHLLNAIGNKLTKMLIKPCIYCSAELFMCEMINAIRYRELEKLQTRYADTELLLVDDFQIVDRKEVTQYELCEIIERNLMSHKSVVIACDRHPRMFKELDRKLWSLISGGIVVGINVPNEEEKKDIVKIKSEK